MWIVHVCLLLVFVLTFVTDSIDCDIVSVQLRIVCILLSIRTLQKMLLKMIKF